MSKSERDDWLLGMAHEMDLLGVYTITEKTYKHKYRSPVNKTKQLTAALVPA